MSDSVDREDANSLLAKINQDALDLVELNNRIKEFQAELQQTFFLNAQNHQHQLNLRLKLFEQLQLLVGVTDISDYVVRCSIDGDVRDGRTYLGEKDDQLQESEAIAKDSNYYLSELEKLMSQHYEQMKGLADAHGQLLVRERDVMQQLQKAHENVQLILKDSAEKGNQLDEANKKLAESGAKNHELCAELTKCMQQLQSGSIEKNSALAQLQKQLEEANKKLAETGADNYKLTEKLRRCKTKLRTSRELALMTKLRQLRELEMTETLSAMVSRLQEEHKVTIAENIEKTDNVTRCRYSKDETAEPKPIDARDSGSPDHLRRLRENHQQLTELLEARKVAASMFEHDALTIRELQSIQQHVTPIQAAEDLLKIVLELGREIPVYECFMNALQKANQQHIWSWLLNNDFDINCEHVPLIQKHYSSLVITIEHSGLIPQLFSCGVIDDQDKDYLEAELSCVRRNEKMLSMLKRRSKQQFDLFLDCLIETGQRHVAAKLCENLDSPDNSSGEHPFDSIQLSNTTRTTDTRDHFSGEHPLASTRVSYHSQTTDIIFTGASSEKSEHQSTHIEGSPIPPSLKATYCLTAGTSMSHVISSKDGKKVAGVTFCNEILFVLREKSRERIEQYDVETFNELKAIRVEGLDDAGWCKSMTSCCINNCLYVNDYLDVFRVDLSTKKVISWRVDGRPCGLSVNKLGNVLVTCHDANEIIEYSTSGSHVSSIKLKVKHVKSPVHTVQLTDSRYVVCHLQPVTGVSLIGQHGALITSYRNSDTTRLVSYPRWIVVVNDRILVADVNNNRILTLNSSLNIACELSLTVNCRLNEPSCMCFDESNGRLFVGELGDECRVLVFNNIQWT